MGKETNNQSLQTLQNRNTLWRKSMSAMPEKTRPARMPYCDLGRICACINWRDRGRWKKSNDITPVNATKSNETEGSATTTVETEAPTEAEKTSFSIGESAEQKNVIVTLTSVNESEGSKYNKPAEGNIFVLAEFTIENNSDKEIAISSMLSFDCYQDGYATNISLSALMEKGSSEQLDGSIASGKKMKGVIGYEIPKDYKELKINVQLDVWSSKKFVFVYTK